MASNHILTYKMTLKRHEATHHPRVTKLNTENILINGLVKNKVITWTQPWGERRAQKNNADNSSLPPLNKIMLFLLNLQTGGIHSCFPLLITLKHPLLFCYPIIQEKQGTTAHLSSALFCLPEPPYFILSYLSL